MISHYRLLHNILKLERWWEEAKERRETGKGIGIMEYIMKPRKVSKSKKKL